MTAEVKVPGRPTQRSALHAIHLARVPTTWIATNGYEVPDEFESAQDELVAATRDVVLIDTSHRWKLECRGPGIRARLAALDIPLPESELSLIQFARGWSAHLPGNSSLACAEERPAASREVPPTSAAYAHVVDATSAYCGIALVGPRAVDVLSALTEMNCDELRPTDVRMSRVAGSHAILAVTEGHESSVFELHVPRSFGAHVWSAALRAGQADGIRPAGLRTWRKLMKEYG